ncbi:DUF6128 domain-containing protein [Lachnospira eligens]|uniref:DUF6128 domain-containing protein n=1 Tax=Lachnospira eligens TaxID=39485 RepID=UPI000E47234C|nr:DUF6128 domain-containing protein [Lachnospira eligens]RHM11722.1 hypothetical protein DWZ79_08070 [Lachnospira eligens]HBA11867.1 hypothetical protein [Eubacterium sp.]
MDYQRLVSYIYSYPEGVKGRNVGFAKALVHQGQFKLNISLRGVKTDSPEMFGIYMMVTDGGYRLIKLGECLVKMGQMEYSGIFNPDNINETGYGFKDICGLAVAREDARYDCMLSMWKDEDVTPDMLVFSGMDAKKQAEAEIVIKERMRQSDEEEKRQETAESSVVRQEMAGYNAAMRERGQSESGGQQPVQSESAMLAGKSEMVQTKQIVVEEQQIVQTKQAEVAAESVTMPENIKADGVAAKIPAETQHLQQKAHRANATQTDPFEKLFVRADYIDAFDDDYFYDCIEVSPEKLKCLNQNEIDIAGNSFLLHGYYNFRHILFGRVRDNLDNTKYFIGVPGMYCNRERYMASMFGFNNFKKSHRSDYANPYFGYWYQEI